MKIQHTVRLNTGSVAEKRQEIRAYYDAAFAQEELLYQSLKHEEAFYQRADPLRHPLIFYYGHTAVFMINKLMLAKLIDQRIDPELESIFAIGVDEMSWDDLNEQHYKWPSVEKTRAYRHAVARLVRQLIDTLPMSLPIDWDSAFWPIMMGIEHLKIHIETSSVLIRQLPLAMVKANTLGKRCMRSAEAPQNALIPLSGGLVTMGKSADHPLYGWDNEYGMLKEEVKPFEAAKYLVSNGEFLDFVEAGGYQNAAYWTEEGWAWRQYEQADYPRFWIKQETGYMLRLMDEEIAMPWDWPVEINYLEAKAFCNWKSEVEHRTLRLPTEAEWLHLYHSQPLHDIDQWEQAPGNINLEHYSSPCPVNQFAMGPFYDLIGNVWQWTETPISGYPGFKVHPLYDDFSTPTFDDKHNLFKGGSWISTGNEASQHARYAFRRHFYQHAGFRYIASDYPAKIESNIYETDPEVARSCEENYGEAPRGFDHFYTALAQLSLTYIAHKKTAKVLDINCDTGRLAFELSNNVEQVTAIDASARFIKMAIQLQEKGHMRYVVQDEGDLVFFREVQLAEIQVDHAQAQRIQFMQGDAANLKSLYTGYDMIIAPALLEELYDPTQFLTEISKRLNPKGILIITSSYNWDSKRTAPEHWLGGFKKDGEPVRSFEGLSELLKSHFELINTPFNLSKTTRLSRREFSVSEQEVSVWQLRE